MCCSACIAVADMYTGYPKKATKFQIEVTLDIFGLENQFWLLESWSM